MQKRDSITNPRDARLAVMQERTALRVQEKCSMQFALIAAKSARFLSTPLKAKLYIAASALQQKEQNRHN
jgi:hypothetical protein